MLGGDSACREMTIANNSLAEAWGDCDVGASRLVWQYFGDCIYTSWEGAAFCIGLSSIVFWVYAQVPQVIRNFRTGSVDALSPWFLVQWLGGDAANLLGCILDKNQLITQLYTAAYFIFADIITLTQYIYYRTQDVAAKDLQGTCEDQDDLGRYVLLMPSSSPSTHSRPHSVRGAWEAGSAGCKREGVCYNDNRRQLHPTPLSPNIYANQPSIGRRLQGWWWWALASGDLGWQGVAKCVSSSSSGKHKGKGKEKADVRQHHSESVRGRRSQCCEHFSNETNSCAAPPETRAFQRVLRKAVDEIGLDSSAHFLVGHDWHLGIQVQVRPLLVPGGVPASSALHPHLPAPAAAAHLHPLSHAQNYLHVAPPCIHCQQASVVQAQAQASARQQRFGGGSSGGGCGWSRAQGVAAGKGKMSAAPKHEIWELERSPLALEEGRLQQAIGPSQEPSTECAGKESGAQCMSGRGQLVCMAGLIAIVLVAAMGVSMSMSMHLHISSTHHSFHSFESTSQSRLLEMGSAASSTSIIEQQSSALAVGGQGRWVWGKGWDSKWGARKAINSGGPSVGPGIHSRINAPLLVNSGGQQSAVQTKGLLITNWVELLGMSLGWLSSLFYLGSRVAQILKTHSRGSAEGLALEMFGCAIAGNLTYGVAVLMRADSWADLIGSGPWLLGSLGTLSLDITIFIQARWLARRNARRQECATSVYDC